MQKNHFLLVKKLKKYRNAQLWLFEFLSSLYLLKRFKCFLLSKSTTTLDLDQFREVHGVAPV